MNNILDIGDAVLTAIVLIVAAGIATHICFGYGTRKWRESFVGLICSLLIAAQVSDQRGLMYLLIRNVWFRHFSALSPRRSRQDNSSFPL